MAEFDTLRPEGAWLTGTPVTPAEFAAFDAMRPSMLNGTEGSFHEPIAPIILGGEGLQVTKAPSHDNDVTTKVFVEDLFATGGVVTSMRAVSTMRDGLTWFSESRRTHYGWGKNVGVVGVSNLASTIVAARTNSSGSSAAAVTLFTPVVAPAGSASFAQNEDGSIIVGHGTDAGQRVWYSHDGGLTWAESTITNASSAAVDVLVGYDRFTGNWYVFRTTVTSSTCRVHRSTNNGVTWTEVNSTLPSTADWTSVAFSSGAITFNSQLNTLNSTYRSTNNGTTWSNAFAPANRYVNSVVEWDGDIYALGHNSTSVAPWVGRWNGSSWADVSAAFVAGPVSFTRFATTLPGLIVAFAISAFGSSGSPYFMASRDGGLTWRTFPMTGTGYYDRYQSPSPGGIHVMTSNSNSSMTLATMEI